MTSEPDESSNPSNPTDSASHRIKPILSPKELADAIGVSESSIKRWADDGLIRATRTAGGHRRIPLREALRFVRESRSVLVRPEALGLTDVARVRGHASTTDADVEHLFGFLESGADAEARGLVSSLYLDGLGVAEIIDGPLRGAMERLGELWHSEETGIFREHRATDIAIQALNQLRAIAPLREDAPAAVGGAPADDPYLLPSLGVATVLESVGYRTTNLGADTPVDTFRCAAQHLAPRLLWISVSCDEGAEALAAGIPTLLERVEEMDGRLIVGGRARRGAELPRHPRLFVGSSMGELEAYVSGLSASG